MQWSLVKSWAKSHGYTSFREKTDRVDNPNKYDYYWGKENDPSATGMAISVSKLATEIYNHITDNTHLDYQNEYALKKAEEDIDHENFKEGW